MSASMLSWVIPFSIKGENKTKKGRYDLGQREKGE